MVDILQALGAESMLCWIGEKARLQSLVNIQVWSTVGVLCEATAMNLFHEPVNT